VLLNACCTARERDREEGRVVRGIEEVGERRKWDEKGAWEEALPMPAYGGEGLEKKGRRV